MKFQLLKISLKPSLKVEIRSCQKLGNRFEIHLTQNMLANYTVLELDSEERSGLRNFPWTFPRLSKHGVVKAFS